MSGLTDVQKAAVGRLVSDGTLTAAQADAVLAALAGGVAVRKGGGWLAEAAGYLGGGLMLGGAMLVLGESWEQLTRTGRAGFIAGVAAVLLLGAVLAAGGPFALARLAGTSSSPRRRVTGVLLALVAPPTAFAVAIGLDNPSSWSWGTLAGFALSVVVVAAFSTPVAVVVCAGLSVAALLVVANDVADLRLYENGLLLVGLGMLWLVAALARLARPRELGVVIGAGLAIFGAQLVNGDGPDGQPLGYTLTFAIAMACLGIYRFVRDVTLVVAGVVGVTISVPEAVYDFTDGRVSGAYIVLIGGIVLVLASAAGFRIRKSDSVHS